MIKIITLSIIALLSANSFAQNFSAEVPDLTLYAQPTIFTFEGDIDLYNHTFGDLNMAFENIEQVVPVGWETSNCLGANCLPIGVLTGTFTLPVVSPDNYIIGHFYPNNVAGSGYMKIKVYEQFNPTNYIVLTYYGVAGQTTNINQLKEADVQVFPNPATDVLNVLLPNDNGLEMPIQIIDALGRLVKSEITTQSTTTLNISDLDRGVYIVVTGNVRKKIVKQ